METAQAQHETGGGVRWVAAALTWRISTIWSRASGREREEEVEYHDRNSSYLV